MSGIIRFCPRFLPILAVWIFSWSGPIAHAQTYVGNLNGISANSTFEGFSTQPLPAAGWIGVGSNPQIFQSTNTALINDSSFGFAPFGAEYITASTLAANSNYTLSFRMGYFSSTNIGDAQFEFELGTTNGGTFTSLQSTSGTVPYEGSFSSDGNNSITQQLIFNTGASVSADPIAVLWQQTNTSSGADFLGFDNVVLSYTSAVPEPSIFAFIAGLVALGLVAGRRIKRA